NWLLNSFGWHSGKQLTRRCFRRTLTHADTLDFMMREPMTPSQGVTPMIRHFGVCPAAGTLILMVCAELAGCANADTRLPPAVTTAVARDFNEGDPVITAAVYADNAEILAPQHPPIR